jgi:hypothetical protein
MIESPKGVDRGRFLFEKYEDAITAMCKERIGASLEGKKHKALRNICTGMDSYIDNTNPAISSFVSDIAPPTIRKAYWEFISLFSKFLETPPLFSVSGGGKEKDAKRNALLSYNNDNTYFKERCLDWNIDHIVRYGTTATYSYLVDDYNANSLITVNGYESESGYMQQSTPGELAVVHMPIHPLNVIMDPRATYQTGPDWQGFISDICLSNISKLKDNPAYIAKNLQKAFEAAKQGVQDSNWFCGEKSDVSDYSKGHTSISYLWTKLNFEGNEDDHNIYAIEIIQSNIIRIEQNNLDAGIVPLSVIKIMPKLYNWFGTSMLIDKICIQNAQYFLTNATIEATAKLNDRMTLYNAGTLDIPTINMRHRLGGMVPVMDQSAKLSDLVHPVPMPNQSFRENDWLTQEMRRMDADTSAMPNFNPQTSGGPGGGGQTLGGQQMIASIGELKMGKIVSQMAGGLKDIAKNDMALFINGMDDVEPINVSDDMQVSKSDIVGKAAYTCNISNVFNYQREGIDASNRLNMVINRLATKVPQFQAIKLTPLIEDEFRNALKGQNIDNYIDREAMNAIDEKQIQALTQPPQAAPQMPSAPGMPPPPPPQGGPVVQ